MRARGMAGMAGRSGDSQPDGQHWIRINENFPEVSQLAAFTCQRDALAAIPEKAGQYTEDPEEPAEVEVEDVETVDPVETEPPQEKEREVKVIPEKKVEEEEEKSESSYPTRQERQEAEKQAEEEAWIERIKELESQNRKLQNENDTLRIQVEAINDDERPQLGAG